MVPALARAPPHAAPGLSRRLQESGGAWACTQGTLLPMLPGPMCRYPKRARPLTTTSMGVLTMTEANHIAEATRNAIVEMLHRKQVMKTPRRPLGRFSRTMKAAPANYEEHPPPGALSRPPVPPAADPPTLAPTSPSSRARATSKFRQRVPRTWARAPLPLTDGPKLFLCKSPPPGIVALHAARARLMGRDQPGYTRNRPFDPNNPKRLFGSDQQCVMMPFFLPSMSLRSRR